MMERTRVPQRRVHCTSCAWSGKRSAEDIAAKAVLTPCPECRSPVEPGSGKPGRPAFDPEVRRVKLGISLLPATIRELERSGPASETAVAVLEAWAVSKSKERSSRARRAARTRARVKRGLSASKK